MSVIAKVIPIFKKGDKSLFENYRPISLLPVVSKMFERVIFDQLHILFLMNFFVTVNMAICNNL